MMDEQEKGLSQYTEITLIDPSVTRFTWSDGGFLSMEIEGAEQKYARVNLHRAFPLTSRNEYISVRDIEGKEIGMIETLDRFPAEMRKAMNMELDRRYFIPEIMRIISIKEEFGYSYWDVGTDAGACRFTVRNGHGNIMPLDSRRIMVTDADGNRFLIPDAQKLTARETKLIEPLMSH